MIRSKIYRINCGYDASFRRNNNEKETTLINLYSPIMMTQILICGFFELVWFIVFTTESESENI